MTSADAVQGRRFATLSEDGELERGSTAATPSSLPLSWTEPPPILRRNIPPHVFRL